MAHRDGPAKERKNKGQHRKTRRSPAAEKQAKRVRSEESKGLADYLRIARGWWR